MVAYIQIKTRSWIKNKGSFIIHVITKRNVLLWNAIYLLQQQQQQDHCLKSLDPLTFSDKEIEHGQNHRVAAEHVVSTRVDSGESHPKSAPDSHGSLQLGPHVAVDLRNKQKDMKSTGQSHTGCKHLYDCNCFSPIHMLHVNNQTMLL